MGANKITAMDVARAAGVSQPTVSRVFSAGGSVSPALATKVREAAVKLGYRPNTLARSLTTGQSKTIGLIVAYLDNPFYTEALERLSRSLKEMGYNIMIFMAANEARDVDEVVQSLLDHQVDGILMASISMSSELTDRLADEGVPVVLFNRGHATAAVTSVTSANALGGRKVAEFLLAGDHTRIAHISGWQGASTGQDRLAGFVDTLEAAGLSPHSVIDGMFSRAVAAEATRKLMTSRTPPDAIFVGNDHMAFAVLDTLRVELGVRVPDDISVVGYDDVAMAGWAAYDLTTVRQPANRMVQAALAELMAQINGEDHPPRTIEIDGPLIIRGSARRPAGDI
ncbi:LacI family DNA-binding transcriptional regulator [Litoreibacter roseus]|uniref:LacI family transcriptional regulator n=1 Tax=Litoreibacter roseus TaxID=2601869 RepID=A0A6N6JCU6_9RHOB|nr:LacI family DNA-binding transcriptional regulator [Litoreibacter roseus]GFE63975.1 LacI family transcriptional regulator [Litoreibacter roseus]